MKGLGIDRDDAAAVTWLHRAAEGGNVSGMYSLGRMYEKGRGVGKDTREALRWYRLAAEHGYPRARPAVERLEQVVSQWSRQPSLEPNRKQR
jgi:TPR repeat protein